MDEEKLRRFFFGVEVCAPWPDVWPSGRHLPREALHMTLAFLGNVRFSKLEPLLADLPLPDFKVGKGGYFDKQIFLPPKRPRVVCWHAKWSKQDARLLRYQERLSDFLRLGGFQLDDRPFLPHVTLARWPFKFEEWRKAFHPLPFFLAGLQLYETVGSLQYEKVWSKPFVVPFEEVEHTADRAFLVRGEDLTDLFWNAQLALSWEYPTFLKVLNDKDRPESLDDVIIALNDLVSLIDREEGSPLKAVSFHGDVEETAENVLQWEMIVDV